MVTFTITNKSRPKATVIMIVSLFGRQYRKSIGVGVPAKYWNAAKHRAKITADFDGNVANDAIDRWEEIGRRAYRYFSEEQRAPLPEEFAEKLDELAAKGREEPTTVEYLPDYLEQTYIPRYQSVRGVDTVKIYRVVLHKLRDFEDFAGYRIKFDAVTIDFYNRF